MLTDPDWRAGIGYPAAGASIDIWEYEFLRRGKSGLEGRPHFKLTDDLVEFFVGPSMMQIEDDGSILAGPDTTRSSANRMVIEFHLNQDIDAQIEKAKRWLVTNQQHRYAAEKRRIRETKYRAYLRAFDGSCAGASLDEMAKFLYPNYLNEYPDHDGRKQVSKDIGAARKLVRLGFRSPMNRI